MLASREVENIFENSDFVLMLNQAAGDRAILAKLILGGKDHSTIKHGIEKIENELQADETLSNTINIIKKKINPA